MVPMGDGVTNTRRWAIPELCIEHTPLTHAETVLQIHLAYIAAGAELFRPIAYGANRIKLASYGLQDKVEAINGQAVKLAREAKEIAGKDVLIAGSISPIELLDYPNETLQAEAVQLIREAVQEQARALEGRGVDLFILETYSSLAELSATIDALRSLSTMPIVAQMTFAEDGRTLTGVTAQDVARVWVRSGSMSLAELQHRTTNGLDIRAPYPPWSMFRWPFSRTLAFPARGWTDRLPLASPELFREFAHEALTMGRG